MGSTSVQLHELISKTHGFDNKFFLQSGMHFLSGLIADVYKNGQHVTFL